MDLTTINSIIVYQTWQERILYENLILTDYTTKNKDKTIDIIGIKLEKWICKNKLTGKIVILQFLIFDDISS